MIMDLLVNPAQAANEFSATGTQQIFSQAIAAPQEVLAVGIVAILAIILGVWAIFWVVKRLTTSLGDRHAGKGYYDKEGWHYDKE